MRKKRVLLLVHPDLVPPDTLEGLDEKQITAWKTEYDVAFAIEHLGHETRIVGIAEELASIRRHLGNWKPHIVFNLLEEFRGQSIYVPYLLGYLELAGQAFTGCNPSALIVADNKPLMKKILRYHKIPSPDFAVFPRGKVVRPRQKLSYPMIVKSSADHGSVGVSQASVVYDEEALRERVAFVHQNLNSGAIAEEYIEGRELYIGILGNRRLDALPIWEMHFGSLTDNAPRIATEKIKWDLAYRDKIGLTTRAAKNLPDATRQSMIKMAKRAYRILGLNGYARMDFRLREDGKIFLLEPNPNPDLAHDEDFAESAHSVGIHYDDLIQRIITLGLRYHGTTRAS